MNLTMPSGHLSDGGLREWPRCMTLGPVGELTGNKMSAFLRRVPFLSLLPDPHPATADRSEVKEIGS